MIERKSETLIQCIKMGHNNLINFIVNNLAKSRFKVYSDLPGWEEPGGGTIPSPPFTPLTTLHSFMRTDMKKSSFLSNLNSLAWYGSYQIWLTREDKEFAIPPFLIPHL